MRKEILLQIIVGAIAIAVVTFLVVPALVRHQSMEDQKLCQENLVKIDGAKQQWALKNNQRPSDTPAWSDLYSADGSGFLKEMPRCRRVKTGESYEIKTVNEDPVCKSGLPGHGFPPCGPCAITDNEY